MVVITIIIDDYVDGNGDSGDGNDAMAGTNLSCLLAK